MTHKERSLLVLASNGLTTNEIVKQTKMTRNTVDSYFIQMFRKYDCRNRAHLVAFGFKNKIII